MAAQSLKKSTWLPWGVALTTTIFLTACADRRGDDVSLRHPIAIERHAVTLNVSATPTTRRINASTASKLDKFFDGYFDDGGGRLRITTPPGATSGRRLAMSKAIRNRAVRRGIDISEIDLESGKSGKGSKRTYQLHYLRHTVRAPRCGRNWYYRFWEGWSNKAQTNYGCASQSYLGRMAARPRDLVKAHPAGPRDTTRSNKIIHLYREGEPTGAKEKPDEKSIRTLTIK